VIPSLRSGNTFGERLWTDGWRSAPMLPGIPHFIECPACHRCLWLTNELIEDPPESDSAFDDLPQVHEPGFLAYLGALSSGVSRSIEDEVFLRTRAWWRSNDPQRHGLSEQRNGEYVAARAGNMRQLLALLEQERRAQRDARAELLRELERFDECRAVLSAKRGGAATELTPWISRLCEAGDCLVREVPVQQPRRIVIRL
jgi:hypothetical protein